MPGISGHPILPISAEEFPLRSQCLPPFLIESPVEDVSIIHGMLPVLQDTASTIITGLPMQHRARSVVRLVHFWSLGRGVLEGRLWQFGGDPERTTGELLAVMAVA